MSSAQQPFAISAGPSITILLPGLVVSGGSQAYTTLQPSWWTSRRFRALLM